jgi:hypothetical protein
MLSPVQRCAGNPFSPTQLASHAQQCAEKYLKALLVAVEIAKSVRRFVRKWLGLGK